MRKYAARTNDLAFVSAPAKFTSGGSLTNRASKNQGISIVSKTAADLQISQRKLKPNLNTKSRAKRIQIKSGTVDKRE